MSGKWWKLHEKKLHNVYSYPHITQHDQFGACVSSNGHEKCKVLIGSS